MENALLRKPIIEGNEVADRYAKLGLRDNPFPADPALVIGSPDDRLNGSIYCRDLHSRNIDSFRDLLIPTRDRRPVRSLAFLMDHASLRGRGIGKSAFLKHQRDEIMKDLGETASSGSAVLFAAYVVPTASPPCRKFWEFCRLIAHAMCDQGVIAKAMWRLRAMSGAIPAEVLAKIGDSDDWESTIGSDSWLHQHKVDTYFALADPIKATLSKAGVAAEWVEHFANHGASIPNFGNHVLRTQGDSFWRRSGGDWVFGDLVRLFAAAQFTRGILLVDELEKIVYNQNIQERRAFVDALRFYMLDGSHNARVRFYGMLLTIHPGIQEILLPYWKAAGLDRLAPLNQPDAEDITLYFSPLDQQMSMPLVTVYLDHFRASKAKMGTIHPFAKEAVVEALVKSGGVPGRTLRLLHRVVERAVDLGRTTIDKEVVDLVYQSSEPLAAGELVENESMPKGEVNF